MLNRGLILYQQGRYEQAANEFRGALAAEPGDARAHGFLALCLLEQEKFEEATREAREGVGLAPDLGFAHEVMARVWLARNYLEEAEASALAAIELDAEDAEAYSLLAAIRMSRRDWAGALKSAEEALRIDPEHVQGNNFRAMALVQLGRREEAGQTIDSVLRREPENALTHANRGWTLLHQNQPQKAMEHFREALRLDPQMDWARQGILEALRARHIVYRLMLMYFLWMSRLSRGTQFALIIGGYIGYRVLHGWTEKEPGLGPFLWPILGAYIAFVFLCWTAPPLFNSLLRLNRFGRLVLSDEERMASNWIVGGIVMALSLLIWGAVEDRAKFWQAGILFGFLVLPLGSVFQCPRGWPRNAMAAYTAGLAALMVAVMWLSTERDGELYLGKVAGLLERLLLIGMFASLWVANGLMMRRQRR